MSKQKEIYCNECNVKLYKSSKAPAGIAIQLRAKDRWINELLTAVAWYRERHEGKVPKKVLAAEEAPDEKARAVL